MKILILLCIWTIGLFSLSAGTGEPFSLHVMCGPARFDVGDSLWSVITTFGQNADRPISTEQSIKQASISPKFYPEALYKSALVSLDTVNRSGLKYTMDLEPNRNYSIWLHFAEIDSSVTDVGQRVFDILINGVLKFKGVDIIKMSGDRYTALVLNTTIALNGRILTIILHPKEGNHAIINAIEVLEVITAESKTLPAEVSALQTLKKALGLPLWLGWNGDPCVPQQHSWKRVYCQFNTTISKWVIHRLDLDNLGLRGFLPDDISRLRHLKSLNLSGNSIHGVIPSSLGTIASLEVLDLSFNFFDGPIPESFGQSSLWILNLNGNSLSGRVSAALLGRLLNRASFNLTDNAGLCGIPGLPTCGLHLSVGEKVGIALGALLSLLLIVICSVCWWKRRQNILRERQIAVLKALKNVQDASQERVRLQAIEAYRSRIGWTSRPWIQLPPPVTTSPAF